MHALLFISVQITIGIFTSFDKAGGVYIEENNVELKEITSTGNEMILQCTVRDYKDSFKVHFHCTIAGTPSQDNRCYENCQKVGHVDISTNCTEKRENGGMIIKYTSNKSTLPSGKYHCQYKGIKSHSLIYIKETQTTISTTAAMIISTALVRPQRIRTDIGVLLLSILTISIIINVVFFIRCIVMRRIENAKHATQNPSVGRSCSSCLCIETNSQKSTNYHKTREDIYDNLRDLQQDSDTNKSKSSSGRDSRNFFISPTSSQLTRSSTYPYRQSLLVHTPTEQGPPNSVPIQPYMMPFILESGQYVFGTVVNHRQSSSGLYDDVACEATATMPIRQFASTGSLNHRPKRFPSSHTKSSPLPEENQMAGSYFTVLKQPNAKREDLTTNDISSMCDANSYEDTYISGKESDSFKDPVRSAKLEMSREMMAKADTLLREAHNLLKHS